MMRGLLVAVPATAVAIVLGIAGAVPALADCPGTIRFDNSAGTGLWQIPANWNTDLLPAAGDDVCIDGFNVTLSLGSSSVRSVAVTSTASLNVTSAASLTLAAMSRVDGAMAMAGSLFGAGDLVVNGTMNWTGSTMTGPGRTIVEGGLQISGAGGSLRVGRRLEVMPTATVTMSANLICDGVGGGVVVNNAGLWDVTNDADLALANNPCTFGNTGTFRKSGGAGTTSAWTSFNNSGTVQIQSGTVSPGGGTHTGAFDVSAGATLGLSSSGTTNFGAGSMVSGAGRVAVSSGTVNFNAGFSGIGTTLTISAGLVNFNTGAAVSLAGLTLSGGRLAGSDQVTISGPAVWTGGDMSGSAVTVVAGGLQLSGTGGLLRAGRDLDVPASGTVTMSANLLCEGVGGGVVVNNAGLWDVTNDADFTLANGPCTFGNTGTFRKSGGAGTTSSAWTSFNNSGSVEVRSGTLTVPPYTQPAGTTLLNGGVLTSASAINIQGGAVRGAGTISAPMLVNAGEVSPGLSPGMLALTAGGYTQTEAGTYRVEVRGTVPGTEYDQLNIGGTASLAGALAVDTTGFTPMEGQTFTVMTFASRTGAFTVLTQTPAPACGQDFTIQYNPTSVAIQVTQGICPDVDNDGFAVCCAGCSLAGADVCGDCDDSDAAVRPGSTERCDGIDNDCDGGADEGFTLGLACDGTDSDLCQDGLTVCNAAGTGTTCDDAFSGDNEVCDGQDNDCDGQVDENLGAVSEICNGLDDNCNGLVDEGNPGGGTSCATGETGLCGLGTIWCHQGTPQCLQDGGPGPELCDGLDNDCDGEIDESRDSDGDGVGDCQDVCPDAFDPPADCDAVPGTPDAQCDADADGAGDACDCDPLDAGNRPPIEVDVIRVMRTAGTTSIGWDAVPGPGGRYNVYRGYRNQGQPWVYAHECLHGALASTTVQDAIDPRGTTLFHYVVSNTCPGRSESVLGRDSTGTPIPRPFLCPDARTDFDGDGTEEPADNCPGFRNPSQSDVDQDGAGDACDPD